jgi:hypothetical protein
MAVKLAGASETKLAVLKAVMLAAGWVDVSAVRWAARTAAKMVARWAVWSVGLLAGRWAAQ